MADIEQSKGFKTALWGFSKEDVIACIDELTAERLQDEERASEEISRLKDSVDMLEGDKKLLLEKAREICDQLEERERKTRELESQADRLSEKLHRAETEATGYRDRLFNREQEYLSLKKNKLAVEEQLKAVEEQLAAMAAKRQLQEQELARQTEEQIAAARSEAEQKLAEAARTAALDREALSRQTYSATAAEQRKMQQSAQQLGDGMAELHRRLNEVDARIAQATRELEQATTAIHAVLHSAESEVEALGAKMNRFPEIEADTFAQRKGSPAHVIPAAKPAETKAPAHRAALGRAEKNRRTASENLLDKLTRVLGEH